MRRALRSEPIPGRDPLPTRDEELLQAIADEGLTSFTFDGVRRISGAHPETLSRSLQRLEEGLVLERTHDGYRLTELGREKHAYRPAAAERTQILRTYLPVGATAQSVVSLLRGKWFDRMRWVGMSDLEDGILMKWVSEKGTVIVDVRVWSGQMEVVARVKDDGELAEAVRAAHQLTGKLSALYARPSGRRVAMFSTSSIPSAM